MLSLGYKAFIPSLYRDYSRWAYQGPPLVISLQWSPSRTSENIVLPLLSCRGFIWPLGPLKHLVVFLLYWLLLVALLCWLLLCPLNVGMSQSIFLALLSCLLHSVFVILSSVMATICVFMVPKFISLALNSHIPNEHVQLLTLSLRLNVQEASPTYCVPAGLFICFPALFHKTFLSQ